MSDPWHDLDAIEYIGDGVYVAWDGYSASLRIRDLRNEDSEIVIETVVLERLNEFVARKRKGDLR